MKKVIFICLLTVSVCLSDTTVKPADTNHAGQGAAPPNGTIITPAQNATADHQGTKPPTPEKNDTTHPNTAAPPAPGTTPNGTSSTTANTTAKTGNTTDQGKPSDNATSPPKPSENTTSPVKPDDKPTNNTAVTPVTTTEPAKTSDKVPTQPAATTPKPLQARGFDGASFVGGIILTLGLLAIGFMGFKYYKAQTERNYHTL